MRRKCSVSSQVCSKRHRDATSHFSDWQKSTHRATRCAAKVRCGGVHQDRRRVCPLWAAPPLGRAAVPAARTAEPRSGRVVLVTAARSHGTVQSSREAGPTKPSPGQWAAPPRWRKVGAVVEGRVPQSVGSRLLRLHKASEETLARRPRGGGGDGGDRDGVEGNPVGTFGWHRGWAFKYFGTCAERRGRAKGWGLTDAVTFPWVTSV